MFPPSSGLTYSTWLCIDKYSTEHPHPLYLLQIVRKLTDQSECLICLSVQLDCRDQAIIISTQETPLASAGIFILTYVRYTDCKTLPRLGLSYI